MQVPVPGEPAGRLTLAGLRGMRGKILDAASRRGLGTSGSSARLRATKQAKPAMLICWSRPGRGPRCLT